MQETKIHPFVKAIMDRRPELTPKGKLIADFILENPKKTVFMNTKELGCACDTSESTVVRLVGRLGYKGYADFIQALRDFVDTELSFLDRVNIPDIQEPKANRFRRLVFDEIENLRHLYEGMDLEKLNGIVDHLEKDSPIYIIGSRMSYALAYYMGWCLTKIRGNICIFKGSDSTTIDWLTIAPSESLVVIIATSRFPNELIRMAKISRRLGHTLIVISDSSLCPLNPFAHISMVCPVKNITAFGSPSGISCMINILMIEMVNRSGPSLQNHQKNLEQACWENDIFFNSHQFPE
jgi:DNA-binding MurR/RpiR family transcriptional regulator